MSKQAVRLCGKRGLVVWCCTCKQWRAWRDSSEGVVCACCEMEFDEIEPYEYPEGA